jgi:hypothetical protein
VSVGWISYAGIHTYNKVVNGANDIHVVRQVYHWCLGRYGWTEDMSKAAECYQEVVDYVAHPKRTARRISVYNALFPVLLGWGFVYLIYLIVFLVNWVKRGFAQPL